PCREVAIQSSGPNARLLGNIIQADVGAHTGERLLCNLQDTLTIALRISARFPLGGLLPGNLRFLPHHGPRLAIGDALRLLSHYRRHSPFIVSRTQTGIYMAKIFGATSTTDDVLSGISLEGKRILVTGVSAGLGVETARALVAHGAQVVGA